MKKGLKKASFQPNSWKIKKQKQISPQIFTRTSHTPCIQQGLMRSPVHAGLEKGHNMLQSWYQATR